MYSEEAPCVAFAPRTATGWEEINARLLSVTSMPQRKTKFKETEGNNLHEPVLLLSLPPLVNCSASTGCRSFVSSSMAMHRQAGTNGRDRLLPHNELPAGGNGNSCQPQNLLNLVPTSPEVGDDISSEM